jgi:anthranilate phosphoribosyltransferase
MSTLRHTLESILDHRDLPELEAGELLRQLTDAALAPALTAAVLAGLRSKGVTADEVRGFATAMRALALKPDLAPGLAAVDIVGTGGDSSGSLNLSTGAALLTAACGLPVIKHGNRSLSSRCGSADLIEALGLKMPLDEKAAARCFHATGFTFLFAPYYHPATRAVAAVRAALGVRTVFNLLGPLTNPAAPRFYVIGAYDVATARLMADALHGMPIERALVVHGAQGWDEATPLGPFTCFEVDHRGVREQTVDPAKFGLARVSGDALAGGDARANCTSLIDVFERRERGAHRDALALQCALALQVAGRADSIESGLAHAFSALESGTAGEWLANLRKFAAQSSR